MAIISFKDADKIADRFLTLLQGCDINPPTESALEGELLSITRLLEITKNPSSCQEVERNAVLRMAAALHDLAAKVLSVETLSEFKTFVPHLRLISDAKIPTASIGQSRASGYDDDTARKMAELYIGCLAAHIGRDVVLDSPTSAKGDNPDVIFTAEEEGHNKLPEKWALAIKTIASQKGQTIFERIKEASKQIDASACVADKGIVVINAKNALDHDALWNSDFSDLPSALDALREQLRELIKAAEADRPQSEWDALFEGKMVRPVLFMGQSLVRLSTNTGDQIPTSLKMLMVYNAGGEPDPGAHCLAYLMNDYMQKILLGIPGSIGKCPQ